MKFYEVTLCISEINNIMDGFSPERLEKQQRRAGSECFLRALREEMRANQRKITKSVYNLESRNIKKFTKEWQQLKHKFHSAAAEDIITPPLKLKASKLSTMTYDEDQVLELTYKMPFKVKNNKHESAPIRTEVSQEEPIDKTVKPEKNRYSLKVGTKDWPNKPNTREKSISQAKESRRQARQRWVTQWEAEPKESARFSLKRESPPHAQEPLMSDLSRERVDQYVRSLHRLEWCSLFLKQHPQAELEESAEYREHMRKFKCDLDSSVDEQAINYMVSRRYNLLSNYLEDAYEQRGKQLTEQSQTSKNLDQSELHLFGSLAHNSILKLIKTGTPSGNSYQRKPSNQRIKESEDKIGSTLPFALPYSEFISYRETKSTVYQLINMGSRTALKVAFSIYDKNKNGVIDEEDLLQMISHSRTLTFMETDINIMAKAMQPAPQMIKSKQEITSRQGSERTDKQSVRPSGRESGMTQNSKQSKRSKESDQPSGFFPIKEEEESETEQTPNRLSNGRFKLQKLYIFLKGKDKHKKRDNSSTIIHVLKPLNFDQFCKAFDNERPMIIVDLLQFLFGAPLDHFSPHIRKKFVNLSSQKRISPQRPPEQTSIDEKWSQRLIQVNAILEQFVKPQHL